MLPSVFYHRDLEQGKILADPKQQALLPLLDKIHQELCQRQQVSCLAQLIQLWRPRQPVAGLYLYGEVGRGKTYLMDIFYKSLPFAEKKRLHFYRFMQWVHEALKEQQQAKQKNPLTQIARHYRKQATVLCFDEFFVTDVTDAMILGELIKQLFAQGITLLATSNIEPENLYYNGVHRDRFIPAIRLIQKHTTVASLDGQQDYRLRVLEQASLYFTPLGEASEDSLTTTFKQLAPDKVLYKQTLQVNARALKTIAVGDDVLWCHFSVLCGDARGQYDYIELGKQFHAVIISGVPMLTADTEDRARRFISLVDEFYDRRVKLIMSAAVPLTELYQGERLAFAFERTQSRLLEMQSHEYLAEAHKP